MSNARLTLRRWCPCIGRLDPEGQRLVNVRWLRDGATSSTVARALLTPSRAHRPRCHAELAAIRAAECGLGHEMMQCLMPGAGVQRIDSCRHGLEPGEGSVLILLKWRWTQGTAPTLPSTLPSPSRACRAAAQSRCVRAGR